MLLLTLGSCWAYTDPHVMLLLSIYVLYSNVNYWNCVWSLMEINLMSPGRPQDLDVLWHSWVRGSRGDSKQRPWHLSRLLVVRSPHVWAVNRWDVFCHVLWWRLLAILKCCLLYGRRDHCSKMHGPTLLEDNVCGNNVWSVFTATVV